jgi:hypothetical protein
VNVEFCREERVYRHYSVSLDEFMERYYHEFTLYNKNAEWYLDVYLKSGIAQGYVNLLYTIKLTNKESCLDFYDKVNVKTVIKRFLTENHYKLI